MTKHQYYMSIAKAISLKGSCIKRKVGAIIVVDDRIVCTGYNGTPRGYENCNSGGCERCNDPLIKSGEQLEKCICIHAEENAIMQAAYHGISIKTGSIYTLMSPCTICAKMIISSGINMVYYSERYPNPGEKLLTYSPSISSVIHIPI